MPAPRFITTLNQLGAPGVYIQENAPANPVKGQQNRIVGMCGEATRGPVNKLIKLTSYQRFLDIFGGRDKNSSGGTILGKMWKALQNKKWGVMYAVRACAAAAVKASYTLETTIGGAGTQICRLDAYGPGTEGNNIQWKVVAATNGNANYWNLQIKLYGKLYTYQNITTSNGIDNTNQVIGSDDATLIRLTKLADGRPYNSVPSTDGADTSGFTNLGAVVAGFSSVLGTDGAIADSDFTGAGGPMEIINGARGINICFVAERSNAAIKTKIQSLAAIASQRVWLACPDNETVSVATAVSERAAFTTTDRMSYWFNHLYMTDPVTQELIIEEPQNLIASILSNTDPDVHPGDVLNAVFSKQMVAVYNELQDTDRDTLDTGGVSFINRDQDQNGNDMIIAGNALTCDFSSNNIDLDGRFMKDFLLLAMANRIRGDQFKGNTPLIRGKRRAAVSGYLEELARSDRYVLRDDSGNPQFLYQNDSSVNNSTDQQAGLQKDLAIIQLIAKNKILLLQATVGVNATVTQQN